MAGILAQRLVACIRLWIVAHPNMGPSLRGLILPCRLFNTLRDGYNNRAGRDDPKAMDRWAEAGRCAEAAAHYGQVDGR